MKKIFVEVIAKYTKEGTLMPLEIVWEDGRHFNIDCIKNIQKAAALKTGGQGIRYKCIIGGKERSLWIDNERWFVEA